MKVKRMGIAEILRRIWLFSENKIKTSGSVGKKSTQLKVEFNLSLRQKLDTNEFRIRQEVITFLWGRFFLLYVLIRDFLFSKSPHVLLIFKKKFPPTLFFGTPATFGTFEQAGFKLCIFPLHNFL